MIEFSNADGVGYHASVVEFAKKTGQLAQLEEKLEYLANYACPRDEAGKVIDHGKTKCFLYKDFSPQSFVFHIHERHDNGEYKYWFTGGLIYHGSHDGGGDGGAPTFSVNVTPTSGWGIHT